MNYLLRPWIWPSFRASSGLEPCDVLFKYASGSSPCDIPVARPSPRSRHTNWWNIRLEQSPHTVAKFWVLLFPWQQSPRMKQIFICNRHFLYVSSHDNRWIQVNIMTTGNIIDDLAINICLKNVSESTDLICNHPLWDWNEASFMPIRAGNTINTTRRYKDERAHHSYPTY